MEGTEFVELVVDPRGDSGATSENGGGIGKEGLFESRDDRRAVSHLLGDFM